MHAACDHVLYNDVISVARLCLIMLIWFKRSKHKDCSRCFYHKASTLQINLKSTMQMHNKRFAQSEHHDAEEIRKLLRGANLNNAWCNVSESCLKWLMICGKCWLMAYMLLGEDILPLSLDSGPCWGQPNALAAPQRWRTWGWYFLSRPNSMGYLLVKNSPHCS